MEKLKRIETLEKNFGISITYDEVMQQWGELTPQEQEDVLKILSKKQRDFWERYADFYTYFFPKLPFVGEHVNDFLDKANPQAGETIVELGCGAGRVLREMVQKRPDISRIIGVDYSENMLRRARELLARTPNSEKVELVNHDITLNLPFDDESANRIISNWGISYAPKPMLEGLTLPEIRRVLRPNGILVFSALHKDSDMPSLRKKMKFLNLLRILPVVSKAVKFGTEIKKYFPSYTIKEMSEMIEGAGFREIESELTMLGNSVTFTAKNDF